MTDVHMANGAKFIAEHDMIVRWERKEKKVFEPETFKFMKTELEDLNIGDSHSLCFVDVGVSTGWFAIPFAMMGYQVVAFDPNARSIERLMENMHLNGLGEEDILPFQYAASDREGTTTFWYNRSLPLTSGGSIEAPPVARPLEEQVKTARIDTVVGVPVGLIKIDVEGHEMAVLRGAEKTIDQWKPSLVLEANSDKHFIQLERWLDERGYQHGRADTRNILAWYPR